MKINDIEHGRVKLLIYQDRDCAIINSYLVSQGCYQVVTSTKDTIISQIQARDYDMCILDYYDDGADKSGLALLKLIRKMSDTPIIMVSHIASHEFIIKAFDEGADDYVVKPYNVVELIKRITAIVRRCGTAEKKVRDKYEMSNCIFNTADKILTIGDEKIQLSHKQNIVLGILCAYANEILPKKVLIARAWENDNHYTRRSLDVYICQLRRLLKKCPDIVIDSVPGIGYLLKVKKNNA